MFRRLPYLPAPKRNGKLALRNLRSKLEIRSSNEVSDWDHSSLPGTAPKLSRGFEKSGTLNLLYSSGTTTPAETGLKIAHNGQIAFAAGQTFPGTGTVSSVALSAPTSDFTLSGSPISGSGTLVLNWNVAPTPSDTPNAIVKRDSSGDVQVSSVEATSVSATSSTFSPFLDTTPPVAVILGWLARA